MTIDTATGLEAPAELSSERVRDIFSHIARKYERFNALSSFGAYKLWLAGMMRQAPIDESHDVLDIAGGTGDVTFTVARTKHPRHIQCTDLVPEMLDVARMHIDEGDGAGVPIDFEVVDAQDIPYADASYDVITMAYGIRNMPDRPRALSEMFRVLKPGGSLVCLEFSTPPNGAWRALYHFYLRHLIPFWGGLVTGDKDGFVYLAKSIRAFPDQEGLAEMMREAGFTDVTWKNSRASTTPAASRPCMSRRSRSKRAAHVRVRGGGCGSTFRGGERALPGGVLRAVPRAARPVRAAVAGVPDLRPHLLRAAVQLPA